MIRKIKRTAIAATILIAPPLASDVSANGPDPERPTRTRGWIDQWFSYRENADGRREYKLTERLYVRLGEHSGWRFTGRLDVPWIETNETGSANANGLWAGRVGDIHTELYVESPPLAPGLALGGSLRLVWPTGGQSPFGNEQYQWAPALYLIDRLPVLGYDVTLQPLARYDMSYRADRADAQAVRRLDLYPKIVFDLPGRWFVTLYPDRPLEYNQITGQWFIPFELMVGRRLSERLRLGLGWATKVAGSETRYRSLIEVQVQWTF